MSPTMQADSLSTCILYICGGGLVNRSCMTLANSWTISLAGSSVHGISQARIWLYKGQFIGKDPDTGKDWGQGVTEDEMTGWHQWLHAHESEQTPGDSEGQGSLACCSPWNGKESMQLRDWTKTTSTTCKISKGQFSSLPVSPSPLFFFFLIVVILSIEFQLQPSENVDGRIKPLWVYCKSPPYERVLFQEHVHESNLLVSPQS